jgi:hypothetical protein
VGSVGGVCGVLNENRISDAPVELAGPLGNRGKNDANDWFAQPKERGQTPGILKLASRSCLGRLPFTPIYVICIPDCQ